MKLFFATCAWISGFLNFFCMQLHIALASHRVKCLVKINSPLMMWWKLTKWCGINIVRLRVSRSLSVVNAIFVDAWHFDIETNIALNGIYRWQREMWIDADRDRIEIELNRDRKEIRGIYLIKLSKAAGSTYVCRHFEIKKYWL